MIITIIGARPQFVKAAVVSKELVKQGIEEKIIHTGQHYDPKMSNIFWQELGIPNYEINLDVGSGSHGAQTAEMLVRIEEYLLKNKPKIKAVLLYGDTNSTLAGALAASKLGIRIIHIESGLRSFNRAMPEEINRVVTDHLSEILFCPSDQSVLQLAKEGIKDRVYNVGDVMLDALLQFRTIARKSVFRQDNKSNGFILMTIHRPSNTDNKENLKRILSVLSTTPHQYVWPVHPRTRRVLQEQLIDMPSNVTITEPFSYFEMLAALDNCIKVLTDSGGVQKEAYWMMKPCITLRDETEWVETVHNGWNVLAGNNPSKIREAIDLDVDPTTWVQLYGDGEAAKQIVDVIRTSLY